MQRLLSFLSAAGFALFFYGLYTTRQMKPQPRQKFYSGPTIDLNQASEDELRGIEGLGDYVEKILDERPFRSKIDLLERMVVPDAIYREIKDRITVRHAA